MKNKKIKPSEVLNNLLNESINSINGDVEFTKEFLTNHDFNYQKIITNGKYHINNLYNEQLLKSAAEKRRKLSKILKNIETKVFNTTEEIMKELKDIFSIGLNNPEVKAYFHKLESSDKEDLIDMIKAKEILQLFSNELDKFKIDE